MYKAVIVDDEPIIVEGLLHAVDWEAYDFEIGYSTTSSPDALRYMENNAVHLLITDVSMPEMDGLELLQKAKELYPNISIIVVSAFDRFEYVKTALRCGAENYLLKPIDRDEFAESLSQIAGHMQERADLTRAQEYPMLSFRSSLTERWVKNSISPEELTEKADVLGIDLSVSDFTVVIFKTQENTESMTARLYDIVLTGLTGKLYGHFFFENVSTLVCVLSRSQRQKEAVSVFIHDVLTLAQREQMQIFACSGAAVSACDDVNKSYLQACSLLFMAFTGERCVTGGEILARLPDQKLPAQLENLLQSEETESCKKLTEQVFDLLKTDAAGARAASITVSSVFLRHLGKNIKDIFTPFPQLKEVLHKFPLQGSAQAYRKWTLDFITRCAEIRSDVQGAMYPCVCAAIKSIRSFSDKDVSLKCLAAKLNVTPAYLGSLFKKQTGLYFNDYLVKARLEYAEQLILTTDLKMSDIAEKAGFASQTYFNRNFKRAYGASPVVYRREKKAQQG